MIDMFFEIEMAINGVEYDKNKSKSNNEAYIDEIDL